MIELKTLLEVAGWVVTVVLVGGFIPALRAYGDWKKSRSESRRVDAEGRKETMAGDLTMAQAGERLVQISANLSAELKLRLEQAEKRVEELSKDNARQAMQIETLSKEVSSLRLQYSALHEEKLRLERGMVATEKEKSEMLRVTLIYRNRLGEILGWLRKVKRKFPFAFDGVKVPEPSEESAWIESGASLLSNGHDHPMRADE